MRLFLVALIILSASAHSQDEEFGIQIDHITLLVSDIDKSAEFYRDVLMLSEIETPWGKIPWGRMFSTGATGQLHLAKGDTQIIRLDKSIHYAFNVEDFDGYLKFLRDHAIVYGDFSGKPGAFQTRPDGVKQVYFQDPDGYWIEVNSAQYD
jgi:catechol 2,3-dioxygenase-like lactoylglutathione lyase family enzyme